MTLLQRLRSTKPEQPGWWMIERDDMETRPMYQSNRLSVSDGDVFNWHVGPWWWQPDWSKGLRFTTKEDADLHYSQWHFDAEREQMHVRSHGMMTEYYNPDGPEAADLIETLEAKLASAGEAGTATTVEQGVAEGEHATAAPAAGRPNTVTVAQGEEEI